MILKPLLLSLFVSGYSLKMKEVEGNKEQSSNQPYNETNILLTGHLLNHTPIVFNVAIHQ